MSVDEYTAYGSSQIQGFPVTVAPAEYRECTGSEWYMIRALRLNDGITDKAKRGLQVEPRCCTECEDCACTCDFASASPPTLDDVQLSITGLTLCTGVPGDIEDNWDEIEALLATEHNLTHTSGCSWSWESTDTWDLDITGGTCRYKLAKSVVESGGVWRINAYLYTVALCFVGVPHAGFFTTGTTNGGCTYPNAPEVICGDEYGEFDNELGIGDCGVAPHWCCSGYADGGIMSYGGQANLTWSIAAAPTTPRFYDVSFEITDDGGAGFGDFEACDECAQPAGVDTQGKSAITSQVVTEAIQMLAGVGNYYPPLTSDSTRTWRLYQYSSCYWVLGYWSIHRYPGWFLGGQLNMVANGANTDWVLQFYIIDLRHSRKREVDPTEGYFCSDDMNTHRIFWGTETQAQYNCDSPPVFTNDENDALGCAAHADNGMGAGYPEEWYPCATGGRATVTPA